MSILRSKSSPDLQTELLSAMFEQDCQLAAPRFVPKRPYLRKDITKSGRRSRQLNSEIRRWRSVCRRQKMEPTPTIVEENEDLEIDPTVPMEPVKLWYAGPETFKLLPDDVVL